MTETKNQLMELFAACWRDDALKARFLAEPRAVLDEYGLEVPEGVDVKVVENAPDRVYITFPRGTDRSRGAQRRRAQSGVRRSTPSA